MNPVRRYINWLQEDVPTGLVESYPEQDDTGATSVAGLFIAGDLTGVPLLKLTASSGARLIRRFADEGVFEQTAGARPDSRLDVIIVGAGPAGVAAAIECQQRGYSYRLYESTTRLSTIENFPRGKPIIISPPGEDDGVLEMADGTKESLLDDLKRQITASGIRISEGVTVHKIESRKGLLHVETSEGTAQALRVVLAIGKSGNARRLGVPGDDLPHVFNRLFDPAEFAGKDVLVVGGGDSALEASIALAGAGARVVHSYRKTTFSRPKEQNLQTFQQLTREGSITTQLPTTVSEITADGAHLSSDSGTQFFPGDAVFSLIGRELPTDFFKRSGIRMEGEKSVDTWVYLVAMLSFFTMLYFGKKGNAYDVFSGAAGLIQTCKAYLLAPLVIARQHGLLAGGEGLLETVTVSLAAPFRAAAGYGLSGYQVWLNPLNFFLGWAGSLIFLVSGALAIGFMLRSFRRYFSVGWPLIKYSYLILAALAFFVVYLRSTLGSAASWVNDPTQFYSFLYSTTIVVFALRRALVRRTRYIWLQMASLVVIQVFFLYILPFSQIGDRYVFDVLIGDHFSADSTFMQQVFPNGRWTCFWFILVWPLSIDAFGATGFWTVFPFVQLGIIFGLIYHYGKGIYCGWICSCGGMAESLGDEYRTRAPHGPRAKRWENLGQLILVFALLATALHFLEKQGILLSHGSALAGSVWGSYLFLIDIVFAGTLGLGVYFFIGGRIWCRFGCPLAAIMHIMARFSRYRILAEKKKCISCNICTKVCHMGIDVMGYADKGIPMNDVECVRCSACVNSCPMDVLAFGKLPTIDQRNNSRHAVPDYGKDDWRAAIR